MAFLEANAHIVGVFLSLMGQGRVLVFLRPRYLTHCLVISFVGVYYHIFFDTMRIMSRKYREGGLSLWLSLATLAIFVTSTMVGDSFLPSLIIMWLTINLQGVVLDMVRMFEAFSVREDNSQNPVKYYNNIGARLSIFRYACTTCLMFITDAIMASRPSASLRCSTLR